MRNSCVWHILASPGYAPGTIAVNVTRLERGFNAPKFSCQLGSIFDTRQLGPWTRPVNSGSGNRALITQLIYPNFDFRERHAQCLIVKKELGNSETRPKGLGLERPPRVFLSYLLGFIKELEGVQPRLPDNSNSGHSSVAKGGRGGGLPRVTVGEGWHNGTPDSSAIFFSCRLVSTKP